MTDDQPPPDIQESARIFRAWADANPNDIPPADIHAHALKVQNYLRARGASQPQRVDAFEKFKQIIRSDDPQKMPAWSRDVRRRRAKASAAAQARWAKAAARAEAA
jgi:hypothetical protein